MANQHEFKKGDRVRVKRGERHIGVVVDGVATGTVGEVRATGVGTDGDLTCVYLPGIGYEVALKTEHLDLEPIEEPKPHISDVVGVTVTNTGSFEHTFKVGPSSAGISAEDHTQQLMDELRKAFEEANPSIRPITLGDRPKRKRRSRGCTSDTSVEELIAQACGRHPRTDGHSTGPILTGEARTSYLAIQSGAEDPHARPEPLTEPSCDYCKDTGRGHLGMDCPVRGCEAVSP